MEWNKYRIKTTTEAEDFVAGMLLELGIIGVQIEDNVQISREDMEAQYIGYLADLPEDDGTAYVSFYTNKARDNRPEEEAIRDAENEKLLDTIREKLKEANSFLNIGEGSIEKSSTREEDWINNWKKYFKAFTVGDFYIKPTWQKVEPQYKDYKLIEIDPGTSFGTGKHETTQLCITGLTKYLKEGDSVLDIGCGSGILSLVALKLGASHVDMSDIDDAQKKLVDADTLQKLTDAEAALATIDQTAAGNVTTTIGNLPAATDVTTENRAAIKAAREAYDALDETQKKNVTTTDRKTDSTTFLLSNGMKQTTYYSDDIYFGNKKVKSITLKY